ncbi:MAG: zinc ribbon domain-containing protein, partial [Clostridiales bacterium]|nr:zinc ribbon domain-containing protein [Clostridiales bacterium]
MKQYSTLYEAAEFAATLCAGWRFATSDDKYDRNGLLGIAEIHDEENPADEDSFYVVSPYGSIGFCEDGEDIDWLFLSDNAPNE